MVMLPDTPCSRLPDLVRRQAQRRPHEAACVVLGRDGREASRTTYGELDRWARAVAAALQRHAEPGDRALLAFPTSVDFLAALFGCAYAGVVAVPIPLPGEVAAIGSDRMARIIKDAGPSLVLTTPEMARQPENYGFGAIDSLAVADVRAELADEFRDFAPDPGIPAYIQYTSGSTSEPKGVTVSHRNVLAGLADVINTVPMSVSEGDHLRGVSWLPLFHDMGLAQALVVFASGGLTVLIPPMWFVVRPTLWVEAMTRYRAHVTTAPNFGYDLCARRMPQQRLADLDLSEWRYALNGSELVRVETLELFARTFAPAGFDPGAFVPCYGLAETVFFVSGARGAAGHLTVSAPSLELESIVRTPAPGEAIRQIVSCGPVAASLDVRIVDPGTCRECEAGKVGEIWVAGESVTAAYWRRNDGRIGARLADDVQKPYLRTNDLGFKHQGELYVLGRRDDVIILYGRNHYPHDIELTAQHSHAALAPGRVAAFGFLRGEETAVAVVAETARRVRITPPHIGRVEVRPGQVDGAEVVKAVRAAVSADHKIQVAEVILLHPAGLPRTTSGKVRRGRCRELFLAGELKTWLARSGAILIKPFWPLLSLAGESENGRGRSVTRPGPDRWRYPVLARRAHRALPQATSRGNRSEPLAHGIWNGLAMRVLAVCRCRKRVGCPDRTHPFLERRHRGRAHRLHRRALSEATPGLRGYGNAHA